MVIGSAEDIGIFVALDDGSIKIEFDSKVFIADEEVGDKVLSDEFSVEFASGREK